MTTIPNLTQRIRDEHGIEIQMEHVGNYYDSATEREYDDYQGYPETGNLGLWARIFDDGEEQWQVVFAEDGLCAHAEDRFFDLSGAIKWMHGRD